MTEGNIVAARDLLHRRMCNRREECHDKAEQNRADGNERRALQSADGEDNADHARHIERVMAREKDEFQRRKARNEDVRHHAERHDERCLSAVLLQRHTDDRLVVRNNAVDAEAELEHHAEMRERADGETCAAAKNQNAHNGLDGALQDIGEALFLRDESDHRNETDQHRGYA